MTTGAHFLLSSAEEYNRKAQGEVNSNEAMRCVCVWEEVRRSLLRVTVQPQYRTRMLGKET